MEEADKGRLMTTGCPGQNHLGEIS